MEDVIDPDRIIQTVREQGDDFTDALLVVQHGLDLPDAVQDYITSIQQQLITTTNGRAVAYNGDTSSPPSVYHTVRVLSNLVDLGGADSDLLSDLVSWLLAEQNERGYWSNPDLQGMSLPAWDNPENLAVHIMWTTMATNSLVRLLQLMEPPGIALPSVPAPVSPPTPAPSLDSGVSVQSLKEALYQAVNWLETVKDENGALFGMAEANWLYSPALAVVFGTDSDRFQQHRTILDRYIPKPHGEDKIQATTDVLDTDNSQHDQESSSLSRGTDYLTTVSSVTTIARNLLIAGLDPLDPILQQARGFLVQTYHAPTPSGWFVNDDYAPRTSLAALQVLQTTQKVRFIV